MYNEDLFSLLTISFYKILPYLDMFIYEIKGSRTTNDDNENTSLQFVVTLLSCDVNYNGIFQIVMKVIIIYESVIKIIRLLLIC